MTTLVSIENSLLSVVRPGYLDPRGLLDDELLDKIAAFTQVQEHVVAAPSFNRFTNFSQPSNIRLQIGLCSSSRTIGARHVESSRRLNPTSSSTRLSDSGWARMLFTCHIHSFANLS
jgi:hypothetical protein